MLAVILGSDLFIFYPAYALVPNADFTRARYFGLPWTLQRHMPVVPWTVMILLPFGNSRQTLWDPADPNYKNRNKEINLQQIAVDLGMDSLVPL